MITVLLEKIITILEGWIQSFTSHTQHVEDKLYSLDQTASDIKTNTDPISDIKDNTGAVITPIQNIKANTDSIATSSQTSANNTTAILNNVSDGDIILMHDLYSSTADAMEIVIPELVRRGYTLVTVSELAEAKGVDLEDGGAYYSIRGS